MSWWQRLKVAWMIAQMIKPIKHNEKVDEIIAVLEAVVAAEQASKKEPVKE
jgi:hypothetical protein